MSRRGRRWAVGLALMLGVASAAVAGWSWWQRRNDLLVQAASAYAAGDYQRAEERARQRLREAPDDVEALRWLARSTARLGRVASANALFARLGAEALQAEDDYLLGVGLDRAGRHDDAARVWRDGLKLDPDHAATIDRLIVAETTQNRLMDASVLAERLSRLPGWEAKGSRALGVIRAELGDPEGAARALKQALNAPEAASLTPSTLAPDRRLLARSLLKLARPAEAAEVLRKVLADGPDPEASWLASRAALQRGAIPEATAALDAAGSYRADHPLDAEPSPFIGEGRCRDCHADKARLFQASRHTSTLIRGKALTELPYPEGDLRDPDDASVTHAFHRQGDRIEFETRTGDQVLRAVVEYAFGAADHYTSLVGHDSAGDPYIFRLSHFRDGPDSGWIRTTGHTSDADSGQNFLGKPLDRLAGVFTCLFCHATDPKSVLDGQGPAASDRAIGCERCHGPGANHVQAIEARLRDMAIVNPASASAEGRLRVCGQCHGLHNALPLPRTDPFWIRFQSTTLAWSRCYTESGVMDCTTCHNPHHDAHQSEKQHEARCLDCHSPRPARPGSLPADRLAKGSICPVNADEGCIQCHMPRFRSKPLHADFHDHYIRVHRESPNLDLDDSDR